MPLSFADTLIEFARGSIAVLVAALAIYLALRLFGKIAKFIVVVVVILVVLYFAFTTDVLQNLIGAFSAASVQGFFGKGA